jgi:hypothetical protein
LIPELYEYLNPMPFEAAAQMGMVLAENPQADGYTVAPAAPANEESHAWQLLKQKMCPKKVAPPTPHSARYCL